MSEIASYQRPLTYRDLDELPEDGLRYEVIEGALHVSPFPFVQHQRVLARLQSVLQRYLDAQPIGELFPTNTKLVLDDPNGLGPDLFFVTNERLRDLRDDGYYGAPDLVVEVVSSKPHLDRVLKYRVYESHGVARYWLVYPAARELWAYRLDAGAYAVEAELRGDVVWEPPPFPGMRLELARLWA